MLSEPGEVSWPLGSGFASPHLRAECGAGAKCSDGGLKCVQGSGFSGSRFKAVQGASSPKGSFVLLWGILP